MRLCGNGQTYYHAAALDISEAVQQDRRDDHDAVSGLDVCKPAQQDPGGHATDSDLGAPLQGGNPGGAVAAFDFESQFQVADIPSR